MRIVDLRLLPLVFGLWSAEAAVLSRSGREVGPSPVTGAVAVAAVSLVIVAMASTAGFALRAGSPGGRARMLLVRVAVSMLAIGAISGGALAVAHTAALQADPLSELVRKRATVEAVITMKTEPVVKQSQRGSGSARRSWNARATLIELRQGDRSHATRAPIAIEGFTNPGGAIGNLLPGVTLRVSGVLEPGRAARPEAARLTVRGEPELLTPEPWWQSLAGRMRASLRNASAGLAPDPRGLLPGLAVGDERELPEDLSEAMRSVGMSHLTAVSGSNLAIVTGVVLLLMRACRLPRRLAVGAAAVAMVGFVVVVGFEPSVQRAAVMGGIALLAIGLGRRRVGLSALLAAVAILLLVDPWLSLSWGFALSVAATAGLLVVLVGKAAHGDDRPSRPRQFARDAVMVAVVCQLATAPLIAAMGNGISAVGFLANAVATPAVPVATILGLVAAGVGLVAPDVATLPAAAAGWGAGWISGTARFASQLPGATIPWPPGAAGGMSLAGVIAIGVLVVRTLCHHQSQRQRHRHRQGQRQGIRRPLGHWTNRQSPRSVSCRGAPHRGRWVVAAIVAVATGVLIGRSLGPAVHPAWPPKYWAVAFCDVGQGDATVLKSGEGHAVLVDVGPEPARVDHCLRDLGIRVIDLLVITHFHADHIAGIPGALRGRTTGRVMVSPTREPPDGAGLVDRWLADRHLRAEPAAVGEQGQVGSVAYRVVWPRRRIDSGSIANNASVTLLIEVDGVSLLLPGDLEPDAQQALMDATPAPATDVIKIPHHGSRFQDPDLITWSRSRVAVASAGRGNDYGHPAAETLMAWRNAGAVVMRTDTDGDVAVGSRTEDQPGSPAGVHVWARNRTG